MKKSEKKLGKRRRGRICCLQILYSMDFNQYSSLDELLNLFWENMEEVEPDVKQFAEDIVRGTIKEQKVIDELISKCTQNWELERICPVDRNVLRFATFELLFRDDIPPKVTLNEAIDIGKDFGSEDSGRFINGVLDRIAREKGYKTGNTIQKD